MEQTGQDSWMQHCLQHIPASKLGIFVLALWSLSSSPQEVGWSKEIILGDWKKPLHPCAALPKVFPVYSVPTKPELSPQPQIRAILPFNVNWLHWISLYFTVEILILIFFTLTSYLPVYFGDHSFRWSPDITENGANFSHSHHSTL